MLEGNLCTPTLSSPFCAKLVADKYGPCSFQPRFDPWDRRGRTHPPVIRQQICKKASSFCLRERERSMSSGAFVPIEFEFHRQCLTPRLAPRKVAEMGKERKLVGALRGVNKNPGARERPGLFAVDVRERQPAALRFSIMASKFSQTPEPPCHSPLVAALEYSVARASKKLACSTPLRIAVSHGIGCSVTP